MIIIIIFSKVTAIPNIMIILFFQILKKKQGLNTELLSAEGVEEFGEKNGENERDYKCGSQSKYTSLFMQS